MSLQNLPVGAQSFSDLILGEFLYVDKTKCIYNLVKNPKGAYFLSRPRRFGKSLLISTLDAIFRGQKELFKDLWIEASDYSWQEYPVIRVDFSQLSNKVPMQMQDSIKYQLEDIANEYNITVDSSLDLTDYFRKMFVELGKQGKKAVVLIDEYDKPIIDSINAPDKAEEVRLLMRDFYTIIKAQDANIRFVLLTGVSKFAKMTVFSGLNNLSDITMDDRYASLLGYTQEELEHYFVGHIEALASARGMSKEETLDKIKYWYNGYRFSDAGVSVYNPFSTLLLFDKLKFANHWADTGTPTLLVNMMKQDNFNISDEDNFAVDASSLSIFEMAKIDPVVLLYQTGYLTIDSYDEEFEILKLGFPNYEVKRTFLQLLLCGYGNTKVKSTTNQIINILRSIEDNRLEDFFENISVFLSGVPYDINIDHEKYYQTIFFCILTLLGVHIEVEVSTNRGRIDTVIHTKEHIYVIEFKLNGTKEEALQQIKDKGYAEKYQASAKRTVLLGVEFSQDMRNISNGGWVVEE